MGGLLSFFSPCVLPLIPGYLANISGTSLKELSGSAPRGLQSKIFFNSIA
ncbi:MAG: cytochrome C biogenesis protein, partial [Thaumarchaeota archaeon]|nr:cytochrome C biogenesis protein [Nitrososphaerota archaeon]